MKLCVMCKHFYKESGFAYSEMTQGDGYMSCRQSHWHCSDGDSTEEFRAYIKMAATCKDYDDTEAA